MRQVTDDSYMQSIADIYEKTKSLQRTAEEMGIAYAKVRKILITMGKYTTPFSETVLALRQKGYSVDEIAVELGTTSKRITQWLPYERNLYNTPEKSADAIRSGNYRARIERAKNNFVFKKYSNELTKKESKTMEAENKKKVITGEPIRLHLKLQGELLSEDEQRILKTYGRSSSGISIERDILIPPDMTLHALHYAIQKLYGWQNSHLHEFRLPEDVYKELTGNTVRGWGDLIGVLFQTVYPHDAWAERYGDDDYYECGSISPKTWLRRKYTGPYDYLGYYELYENAVFEFDDFVNIYCDMDVYAPWDFKSKARKIIKKAPVIDLSLEELNASMIVDDGTDALLERLIVASVLAPVGKKTATAADLNKRMKNRFYRGFGMVKEPEVKPVTNKLFYNYDFGDGWVVEITRMKNCNDLLDNNLLAKEEYEDALNTIIEKYRPVCLHQDGMFLLDDVGGMGGFIDMLQTLFESDDAKEKEEMRVWAYSMGWSTRKAGNRTLL